MPELSNEDAGATSWRILCNDNNLLDAVALDCEMIQLRGGRQALARCSIVNWHGAALFDEYVHTCSSNVDDYLTWVSGILPQHLEKAPTFEQVQARAGEILNGRVLIGHAVENDLKALKLAHPAELTIDTQQLDWGRRATGLKQLAHEVLGEAVQEGAHSPVEDARVCLRLFKLWQRAGVPEPRCEPIRLSLPLWPTRSPPCDVVTGLGAALESKAPASISCAPPQQPQEPHETAGARDEVESGVKAELRLPWSRHALVALLKWFAAEASGSAALSFAASLNAEERALVHREAQAMSLQTLSVGERPHRTVSVFAKGASVATTTLSDAQEELAHLLYQMAKLVKYLRWLHGCSSEISMGWPKQDATLEHSVVTRLSLDELQARVAQARTPADYDPLVQRAQLVLTLVRGPIPTMPERLVGIAEARRAQSAFANSNRMPRFDRGEAHVAHANPAHRWLAPKASEAMPASLKGLYQE